MNLFDVNIIWGEMGLQARGTSFRYPRRLRGKLRQVEEAKVHS